jgi:hypothetical protein
MRRRGLLGLGLGAGALLMLGGRGAALWSPALEQGRLTAGARPALGALAQAVLDGALPAGDAALAQQLRAFETVIAGLPPAVRQELQLLLSLLGNAAGRLALLGAARPLQDLPRAELQSLLQAMRVSALPVRQQAYFALRDLHCAAFYAEPAHWAAIGYPGPVSLA